MTHDEVLLVTLDVLGNLSESSEGDQSDRSILVTQRGAKDLEHAVHHLVDKGLPDSVPNGVQHKDCRFTLGSSRGLASLSEEGHELGPLHGLRRSR